MIVNAVRVGQLSEAKEADLLPLDWLMPKQEDESPSPKASSLAAIRSMIGV